MWATSGLGEQLAVFVLGHLRVRALAYQEALSIALARPVALFVPAWVRVCNRRAIMEHLLVISILSSICSFHLVNLRYFGVFMFSISTLVDYQLSSPAAVMKDSAIHPTRSNCAGSMSEHQGCQSDSALVPCSL